MTKTEQLSLDEIHNLALDIFITQGCDTDNANALARTVMIAERDGSHSHGLFRIPGYVASLKSGKVRGEACPQIEQNLASVITVDACHGYAPLALERGLPKCVEAGKANRHSDYAGH